MIRTPSGKNLMNLQEAVQWLLDNNALPFQCTADYVGGAEIGLGTIVNPTPAKVRVGSLIFFADSKVSTVIAITSNSFICSDEYNDLVDDVVYVSNVALNASGHLIVTLSNGDTIDAGLIKQVTGFSINASQHLIVSYNDSSTTDLGAIFNGNISISGNITATGSISAPAITGDSIIENMTGYSFSAGTGWTAVFVGAVKNGNKLTLAIFGNTEFVGSVPSTVTLGDFTIPSNVGQKLYPYNIDGSNVLSQKNTELFPNTNTSQIGLPVSVVVTKLDNSHIRLYLMTNTQASLTTGKTYNFRHEITFLLSDNLAS